MKGQFKEKILYCCDLCNVHHVTIASVEKCCLCVTCGEPKGHTMGNLDCDPCRHKSYDERKAKLLEFVPYSQENEYVFEHHDLIIGESNIEDHLFDQMEELDELPEYIHLASVDGFSLNPEHILENALEGHYEDADEQLTDVAGFNKFINDWSDKQSIKTYWENQTKATKLSDFPWYEALVNGIKKFKEEQASEKA